MMIIDDMSPKSITNIRMVSAKDSFCGLITINWSHGYILRRREFKTMTAAKKFRKQLTTAMRNQHYAT
jgi:hypothetical protein